jgi:hypothetical protein
MYWPTSLKSQGAELGQGSFQGVALSSPTPLCVAKTRVGLEMVEDIFIRSNSRVIECYQHLPFASLMSNPQRAAL